MLVASAVSAGVFVGGWLIGAYMGAHAEAGEGPHGWLSNAPMFGQESRAVPSRSTMGASATFPPPVRDDPATSE